MNPATQIVHWPGKDTPMCDKHANQARAIAWAMGFNLSSSVILALPQEHVFVLCKNCENEAKNQCAK